MLDRYTIDELLLIIKAYAQDPECPSKGLADVLYSLSKKIIFELGQIQNDIERHQEKWIELENNYDSLLNSVVFKEDRE